jgi:Protein of unknown function with HXXEE motif
MSDVAVKDPSVAPRIILLLPVAYLAHVAEEWFGGFLAWTPVTLGYEISAGRFAVINGVAIVVFIGGTFAALRYPATASFGASLAALLGLNGAMHTLAAIGFARYSPGVVTGLLVYIPLCFIVLRAYSHRVTTWDLGRAVLVGIVLHALVGFLAFA